MTRTTTISLVLALGGLALAVASLAPPEAGAASAAIDGQAVLEHAKVLASDAFEGRGPGTKGETLTVEYLTKQLASFGLKPGGADGSWVQPVPLVGTTVKGAPPLVFRRGGAERRLA